MLMIYVCVCTFNDNARRMKATAIKSSSSANVTTITTTTNRKNNNKVNRSSTEQSSDPMCGCLSDRCSVRLVYGIDYRYLL